MNKILTLNYQIEIKINLSSLFEDFFIQITGVSNYYYSKEENRENYKILFENIHLNTDNGVFTNIQIEKLLVSSIEKYIKNNINLKEIEIMDNLKTILKENDNAQLKILDILNDIND